MYLEFTKTHPMLYVDDERPNHIVFRANFSHHFKTLYASSAEEAKALLEEHDVSVLIADQRMPGMTGIELCEEVRRTRPQILRVLITAYSDQKTAVDAINRGEVMRYLTKPWNKDETRMVLEEAVSRFQLEFMVRNMRGAILERERRSYLDATRRRLLYNLTDVNAIVASCFLNLENLLPPLQKQASKELYEEASMEMSHLRIAVDHLLTLHDKLNNTTRLEDSRSSYHRVHEIVNTVMEICRHELMGMASIECICPDDLMLWGDRVGISHILIHLLNNARQALQDRRDQQGKIELTASRQGDYIHIQVSDNGAGVPPDLRERIFAPFFTTHKPSDGLGLAVSRELAMSNGGELVLLEDDSAPGATFLLQVPATHLM